MQCLQPREGRPLGAPVLGARSGRAPILSSSPPVFSGVPAIPGRLLTWPLLAVIRKLVSDRGVDIPLIPRVVSHASSFVPLDHEQKFTSPAASCAARIRG